MYDVVALGELLIDFAPVGERQFQANAGGAPANVLAALTKLGGSAAFIGMVGDDDFGRMLKGDIQAAGIDAAGLRFTNEASTTLAFVQLDAHGDRSFTFVRKPGADMLLSHDDVDWKLIESAKLFHFGSVSMTGSPSCDTTLEAARYARGLGIPVSFDPNLRPLLWGSLENAKKRIADGILCCDILKISEEELEFITGKRDLEDGSADLLSRGVKLVLITLGPKGCFYRYAAGCGRLPTYDVKVVDTTGAGDAFFGGVLSRIIRLDARRLDTLSRDDMEAVVDFGNAVGALATAKKGAIPAMPSPDMVTDCMENIPKLEV